MRLRSQDGIRADETLCQNHDREAPGYPTAAARRVWCGIRGAGPGRLGVDIVIVTDETDVVGIFNGDDYIAAQESVNARVGEVLQQRRAEMAELQIEVEEV